MCVICVLNSYDCDTNTCEQQNFNRVPKKEEEEAFSWSKRDECMWCDFATFTCVPVYDVFVARLSVCS